ncbi:MAG: hypothetical protein WKF89_14815 [Chitinophagaceae bacterium]
MFVQAGPITAVYKDGFLRYLGAGGTEIVRMLYFAVRDNDWNTVAGVIKNEVIEKKADVVKTAYHPAMEKPVHISPVTLEPWFNAVATSGTASKRAADERQTAPFCAAWTLGSLKYLLETGAASITYFETFGPGGIATEDRLYPVGVLLTTILKWKPPFVVTTVCNELLKVSSLLLQKDQDQCLLIANHTGETLKVTLPQIFDAVHVVHSGEQKNGAFDNFTRHPTSSTARDRHHNKSAMSSTG